LLVDGPAGDQGAEQLPGQDRVTGLPRVEGQQQPPLIPRRPAQLPGHRHGQLQATFMLTGAVQQVHRGPNAGLQPDAASAL
jgi:hypothetical protein